MNGEENFEDEEEEEEVES